mmetsp:Transcript_29377/g.85426  ORF Transcript_29377/g.85426 Transcript_29377/m.85426 type:complete len:256 (-) Transcript_29377:269-1036(-)
MQFLSCLSAESPLSTLHSSSKQSQHLSILSEQLPPPLSLEASLQSASSMQWSLQLSSWSSELLLLEHLFSQHDSQESSLSLLLHLWVWSLERKVVSESSSSPSLLSQTSRQRLYSQRSMQALLDAPPHPGSASSHASSQQPSHSEHVSPPPSELSLSRQSFRSSRKPWLLSPLHLSSSSSPPLPLERQRPLHLSTLGVGALSSQQSSQVSPVKSLVQSPGSQALKSSLSQPPRTLTMSIKPRRKRRWSFMVSLFQ